MDSNLKVVLRVRPYLEKERQSAFNPDADEPLKKQSDKTLSVVVPQKDLVDGGKRVEQKLMETEFDKVYDKAATQSVIFDEHVAPLIHAFFEGINCTVLAYGQTGSGKSYTMGTFADSSIIQLDSEHTGILPRAMRYIFSALHDKLRGEDNYEGKQVRSFTVKISFIELYNEDFYDLIKGNAQNGAADSGVASSPERRERGNATIQVREDASGALYITGAEERVCTTAKEALDCLSRGAQVRATGSTAMNETSSRSHAIYTISLQQTLSQPVSSNNGTESNSEYSLFSKFHFVDLAGSERLKRTLSTGNRATEGIAINQGLHVLGKVVSALVEKCTLTDSSSASPKRIHIPYRDSKLTRLLQDSIGGNSRTMMLACVAPSEADLPETISTLQYASKARKIKNNYKVNIKSKGSDTLNESLLLKIQDLKAQLESAFDASRDNDLLQRVHILAKQHQQRMQAILCESKKDLDKLTHLSAQVPSALLLPCSVPAPSLKKSKFLCL